ncbi:MAG: hypothetical protein ACK58T_04880, partial [Phycisphaerae bacterium]
MALRYHHGSPLPSSHPPTPLVARRKRVLVRDLARPGDPLGASRAARSMLDFVKAQLGALDAVCQSPRTRKRAAIDPRLWLDEGHWLAWTICGELVSVEEIEVGSMRGSPEVRRLEAHEVPAVFAMGRLIPTVIALYRGDQLGSRPVHRYI